MDRSLTAIPLWLHMWRHLLMLLLNFVMVAVVGQTEQSVYLLLQADRELKNRLQRFFALASAAEIPTQIFYNNN